MTDIPASTSTTASITVGGTISGSLEVPGDHDWYAITLTAGQEVSISLSGSGSAPVSDTYLNVRNSVGTILAHNDDSGGTLNSKIVFTATTTGTYYIDAGAWDTSSLADGSNDPSGAPSNTITGTYTLSVQPYTLPPVWTYNQIATQLVSGYWAAQGSETARHFDVTQGGTITVNYSTLSTAEQTLAIAALGEWSDIIGVKFTPVTSGGQIVFSDAEDRSGGGPIAQTDSVVGANGIISVSHVDISASWVTGSLGYGTGLNTYSFQTYLHEIGHALGLGHAGDYNETADYTQDALYANDAWSTTVMSYFDQNDNAYFAQQGFTRQFVLTPMVADIVAMQDLYGLSTTTRTGDTTYGFNSNAGNSIYDAATMGSLAYTIFDSGGNDTLDYSGFTSNQLINLNPETFSNIGSGIGDVSIAPGTIIENAIGGSGKDTIIANDAGDHLIGNAGNDILTGGAGNDFLTGGSGTDTLTGGAGSDTFSDTAAGLNGDTINDLGVGDKIVITDASLSSFTFNVIGNLLTYNGFEIHLGSIPAGTITASAAAGGGVQLTVGASNIAHPDVQNDFNGDGRSDVLWRNGSGDVTDWLGQASGGFVGNTASAYNNASNVWHIVGTGDFNGDGHDDILWQSDKGEVTDWLSYGNGGFHGNLANADNTAGSNWHVVGTGDFNGDGRDDILWQSNDGQVTDWLGKATGGFVGNLAAADNNASSSWHVVGTGDFNGDGRTDILWRNDNGDITDWLGQANGGFSGNTAFAYNSAALNWHVVGVGDFNGDGRSDILWRSDSGEITDWLGNANGGFSGNIVRADNHIDASWQVASVGDFNGDGRDDILWQNSDGTVTDWLGQSNGGFAGNLSHADNQVSAGWHVQPTEILF